MVIEMAATDDNGFVVENGVLVKYEGFDSVAAVPDTVSAIGKNAFSDAWAVSEVILPESVTEICESAFENCRNIVHVSLPDSLRIIGDKAFKGCSELTLQALPKFLERIGKEAFRGCDSLLSLEICGNGLYVDDCAFGECGSLESVRILGGLGELGTAVFARCPALVSAVFPSDCAANVTEGYTFAQCGSLKSIVLPLGTYDIKEGAFLECSSLESVTVLADSLIITRGAIPQKTVICAPRIPVSGFADGSQLKACHGFFMMLRDGLEMEVDVLSDNKEFASNNFRDIISHTFRSEAVSALHLELTAAYYLESKALTRKDAESFLSHPLLAESSDLRASLGEYLGGLPTEETREEKESFEPSFKREKTVLERYLGARSFERCADLTRAILAFSNNSEGFRELIVYVTDRAMLDKESATLLLGSFAASSDVAVRGTLMKYIAENFGSGDSELELL